MTFRSISPESTSSFGWIVVYRPVKELIKGTHRVAGGELDYRLPVQSDDELGDLAASFNKMTVQVGGVQARIEEEVRRQGDRATSVADSASPGTCQLPAENQASGSAVNDHIIDFVGMHLRCAISVA